MKIGLKEVSFSSTLSINPYTQDYYIGISDSIDYVCSAQYLKDQYAISFLNTKEFISTHIEISKNIPQEDIYDAIANQAYDELALDQAVEYQIQYIETFNNLDEKNRHFQIFIVDPKNIQTTFSDTIDKIKYIDVIIPKPLLIQTLYAKKIIEDSGVHAFVYIQQNDASITIYKEKEFLYTKSIKFSFIDMHEKFCELYGERIDYEVFTDFFQHENLKTTQNEYKTFFLKLYKELFTNINDVLTYIKRAFEIEKFNRIYIGTQLESITTFNDLLEAEIGIKTDAFNFDYGFKTNLTYIEHFHALMQIYVNIPLENRYNCNFTLYKRPPKFIKRESGKIISLSLISLIIAFSYPVAYWILAYTQNTHKEILKEQYNKIHIEKTTREANLKSKIAEKNHAITLLKAKKAKYQNKKNTLLQIYQIKVDYPMKAKLITRFAKSLAMFDVKTNNMHYEEIKDKKIFTLQLVASNDRKITKLAKYLTKTYNKKYQFILENISYDKKLKKYLSEIKVILL